MTAATEIGVDRIAGKYRKSPRSSHSQTFCAICVAGDQVRAFSEEAVRYAPPERYERCGGCGRYARNADFTVLRWLYVPIPLSGDGGVTISVPECVNVYADEDSEHSCTLDVKRNNVWLGGTIIAEENAGGDNDSGLCAVYWATINRTPSQPRWFETLQDAVDYILVGIER